MTLQQSKTGSLSLAALAAMHVGPNVGMKLLQSRAGGKNFLADMARMGHEHGLTGKMLGHTEERLLRLSLGPEYLLDYHAGKSIGKLHAGTLTALDIKNLNIPGQTTKQKYKLLDRIKRISQTEFKNVPDSAKEHFRNAPITGSIIRGVEREKAGIKPSLAFRKLLADSAVAEGTKPKMYQNILGLGTLGAAVHMDPHAGLVQPAWNKSRELFGKSKPGRWLVNRGGALGLAGKMPSKPVQLASDLILSPGLLEGQRIGKAIHDSAPLLKEHAKNVYSRIPAETKAHIVEQAQTLKSSIQSQNITAKSVEDLIHKHAPDVSAFINELKPHIPESVKGKVTEQAKKIYDAIPPKAPQKLLSTGAKVGVGLGGLAVGAGATYLIRKHREKQRKILKEQEGLPGHNHGTLATAGHSGPVLSGTIPQAAQPRRQA